MVEEGWAVAAQTCGFGVTGWQTFFGLVQVREQPRVLRLRATRFAQDDKFVVGLVQVQEQPQVLQFLLSRQQSNQLRGCNPISERRTGLNQRVHPVC